jgi:hypothetical protein
VCIATGLKYTYTTAEQIYKEFRPAPDTPTVRVTTAKVPGSARTEISEQDCDGSKAAGTIILPKDFRRFPQ